MATLTISIIVVFVLGYALIATESLTKVNKAAIALLMLVGCWTLYMVDPMQYLQLMHPDYTGGAAGMVEKVTGIIQEHLGDTATTLFFLMGAMTIVEIVDQNGGFNWVRKVMKTKSKRALLWRIAILTFFLSAILDNLTTSIVMIMILRKLVTDHKDRMVYASLVIIAANSGGAFSPIGDVTTIMLWNKGLITAAGVIAEIFIPSVVSMVIPALILQTMLKGVDPHSGISPRRPHGARDDLFAPVRPLAHDAAARLAHGRGQPVHLRVPVAVTAEGISSTAHPGTDRAVSSPLPARSLAVVENIGHIRIGPRDERINARQQRLRAGRKAVLHPRRNFGINLPREVTVLFERAQRHAQHLL